MIRADSPGFAHILQHLPMFAGDLEKVMNSEFSNYSPVAVSVGEAAKLLGLGKTKVYEMLRSGELQSRTVGRRRLVSMGSIQSFMKTTVDGGCDA